MEQRRWLLRPSTPQHRSAARNTPDVAAFTTTTTTTPTTPITTPITTTITTHSVTTVPRHRRTFILNHQINDDDDYHAHHYSIARIGQVVIIDDDSNNNNNDDDNAEQRLERQFIESCTEQLTPSTVTNGQQEMISQVKFASFVITYCRNANEHGSSSNSSSNSSNTTSNIDNNNMEIIQHDRGAECTDTLFFFPDLPHILQLEFVRYTSCYSNNVISTSTEDNDDSNIVTIDDCLDDYNDQGVLFYMEDVTRVQELCTFTYPLMISSDLIFISSSSSNNNNNNTSSNAPVTTPTTIAPLPGIPSVPPTATPIRNIVMTPTPTITPIYINTTGSDGLSTVGILGITITALFMIMFVYQILTWKFKKHLNLSSRKQQRNDNHMAALQEDESFVASEHSHELGPTPISTMNDDDDDDGDDVSHPPTLDRKFDKAARLAVPREPLSPTITGRSWSLLRTSTTTTKSPPATNTTDSSNTLERTQKPTSTTTTTSSSSRSRSRSKSPHRFHFKSSSGGTTGGNHGNHNNNNNNMKFKYPKPLTVATEHLSDNNPVHTRKRFQNTKQSAAANGHFTFDNVTHNRSFTPAVTTSTSISGNNDRRPISNPTSSINPTPAGQELRSPRPIVPPPPRQQLQQLQQSGKENATNRNTVSRTISQPEQHKPFQPKITAVMLGDTEVQRDTGVADIPMRMPVRGVSSTSTTILRPQQSQQP